MNLSTLFNIISYDVILFISIVITHHIKFCPSSLLHITRLWSFQLTNSTTYKVNPTELVMCNICTEFYRVHRRYTHWYYIVILYYVFIIITLWRFFWELTWGKFFLFRSICMKGDYSLFCLVPSRLIPGIRSRPGDEWNIFLTKHLVLVPVNKKTIETDVNLMFPSRLNTVSGILGISDLINDRPGNVSFKWWGHYLLFDIETLFHKLFNVYLKSCLFSSFLKYKTVCLLLCYLYQSLRHLPLEFLWIKFIVPLKLGTTSLTLRDVSHYERSGLGIHDVFYVPYLWDLVWSGNRHS